MNFSLESSGPKDHINLTMREPDRFKKRSSGEFPRNNSHGRFGRTMGLCIALFALVTHLCHASAWQSLDNTTDGIQIFKKETGEGSLVEFRGVGVVEAPLPLVATVVFDTDRRLEWIEGLVDSRIIHVEDNNNFVEYDHIRMPPFITDRDFVSTINISFDLTRKEMIFHYRPSDDPSAPHTDYIRGSLIDTTFILTSIDNDKKTRVDAQFLCDPKGSIPRWLVNFFMKDWPKTTFRNLRKEVLKPDLSVDPRYSKLLTRGITYR
jgi:START domain